MPWRHWEVWHWPPSQEWQNVVWSSPVHHHFQGTLFLDLHQNPPFCMSHFISLFCSLAYKKNFFSKSLLKAIFRKVYFLIWCSLSYGQNKLTYLPWTHICYLPRVTIWSEWKVRTMVPWSSRWKFPFGSWTVLQAAFTSVHIERSSNWAKRSLSWSNKMIDFWLQSWSLVSFIMESYSLAIFHVSVSMNFQSLLLAWFPFIELLYLLH